METDGLPTPRRHWAMVAILAVTALGAMDGVIANIALPTIARELNASPAGSIWVVNAYQIAIFAVLLPLSSLAEIFGCRRIYQIGAVLFTLASLGCALAPDMPTLIAMRIGQGLGAAALFATNLTMVRHTLPRAMLGRGLGIVAVVIALSGVAGPPVASAILLVQSWPWLFAVNVPLGVAAFVIGLFVLPNPPASRRRFDWVSALLNVFTFAPIILAFEEFAQGKPWLTSVLALIVGLGCGTLLILRSLSRPTPLAPIDLMRIPLLAMSAATSAAAFTAQTFTYIALPFLFEYSFGRSAVETGFLMAPWPLALGILAPISGRMSERYPGAILSVAGLLLLGLGIGLLALLPPDPSALDIGWRMVVAGAGFGLFQQPNNRTILLSAPPERSASASGVIASARLLGQTAGATMLALVFRLWGTAVGPRILLIAAAFALLAAALCWLKPDRNRIVS